MKSKIHSRIAELMKDVQNFKKQWAISKPETTVLKSAASAKVLLRQLQGRVVELNALHDTASTIKADCEHFGLKTPVFEGLSTVASDVTSTAAAWSLYSEYTVEFEVYLPPFLPLSISPCLSLNYLTA